MRPARPARAARHRRARGTLLAATLVATAALGACTGDGEGGGGGDERSPAEVLASAKQTFDRTSGVTLGLTADDLPDGVTGVEKASGVATHDPAFDGSLTVVLSGQSFEVPVVAVDGKVHVRLPLTPGWQEVDPEDYGAPDPADLMSADHGVSGLLTATTGVEKGESVRGGSDNSEVLTEYTGTVPGSAVAHVIPSAQGDFDATYSISDGGELREAVLTGAFYPDTDPVTYTLTIDDYDTQTAITAP